MSINPDKVRSARERKGLSQQQLANAAGTSQTTIDKIERGESRTSRALARIASVLEVDIFELDPDFGQISSPPFAPATPTPSQVEPYIGELAVYASIEDSYNFFHLSEKPIEYIKRPDPLKNIEEAYGILVTNLNMFPVYEPGDIALINPRLPALPNVDVILYSSRPAEDPPSIIARYIGHNIDQWHLQNWNPQEGSDKEFSLSKKDWNICHRIIGKFSRR